MARHCHTDGGGEFSGGNVGLGCAITPPGRWRARTRFARDGKLGARLGGREKFGRNLAVHRPGGGGGSMTSTSTASNGNPKHELKDESEQKAYNPT